MRGEKDCRRHIYPVVTGSSPHARGKAKQFSVLLDGVRIIPACAGKRPRVLRGLTARQDHPRMRGEKSLKTYGLKDCIGSSPHARGKGSESLLPDIEARIIPACAGKSTMRDCHAG